MTRKGFRLGVFAFGLLKLLMAWRTSRKRPMHSSGSREESVAALRAEFKGLRSENFRAVYLGVGLFLGRSGRRPPAAPQHREAVVSGRSNFDYLTEPPPRLGAG